jgi:hypothetical protein
MHQCGENIRPGFLDLRNRYVPFEAVELYNWNGTDLKVAHGGNACVFLKTVFQSPERNLAPLADRCAIERLRHVYHCIARPISCIKSYPSLVLIVFVSRPDICTCAQIPRNFEQFCHSFALQIWQASVGTYCNNHCDDQETHSLSTRDSPSWAKGLIKRYCTLEICDEKH